MNRIRAALLLAALASWGQAAVGQAPRPAPLLRVKQEFLERHWRRPILPQGEAQVREALEATRRSAFEIFRKGVPLT